MESSEKTRNRELRRQRKKESDKYEESRIKKLKEMRELEKNMVDSGDYFDVLMFSDELYKWYLFLEKNVEGFNSDHFFRYGLRMFSGINSNDETEIRERAEEALKANGAPNWINYIYNIQFKYYFFNYKNELRCARLIYDSPSQATEHSNILTMALDILEPNKSHNVINERSSCDIKFFNKKRNLHKSNETSELIKKGGFWSYFVIHKKDELPEGCKFI